MKVLLMAGTYDPFTIGHYEIAMRAAQMSDKLIVLVSHNSAKECAFSSAKRVDLVRLALADCDNIEVVEWEGLVAEAFNHFKATALVRGVRDGTDFDYEHRLALVNRLIEPKAETILLLAYGINATVSSTVVREVAAHGGDISTLVPKQLIQPIKKYYEAHPALRRSREDDLDESKAT